MLKFRQRNDHRNPNAESTDEGSKINDNVEPVEQQETQNMAESSEFYSSSESDSEKDSEERYQMSYESCVSD